ncbi:growth-regulated alpha protein-like [Erpetoichthys calabaricus]|uniref:growth-regulated alpha protein-like n=1 Tax=Erpetoichthys calabaricus TaxID=27687 RepID=UPI002234E9D1|nr:growth-regulated alpha protein-like [Erpetoichthys calabaricus]
MQIWLAAVAVLTVCIADSEGLMPGSSLRCLCYERKNNIRLHQIKTVTIYPKTQYCDNIEIIAILKNGQKVCLNENSKKVMKKIEKFGQKSFPKKQHLHKMHGNKRKHWQKRNKGRKNKQ